MDLFFLQLKIITLTPHLLSAFLPWLDRANPKPHAMGDLCLNAMACEDSRVTRSAWALCVEKKKSMLIRLERDVVAWKGSRLIEPLLSS